MRPRRYAATISTVLLCAGVAGAQSWPQIYDPLVLRTLNLQMNAADWQTIQNDETFDIWVPTMLSLDGEPPILVAIRRKSADPLDNAPGYRKVSYKIDINEYVSGQNWHGLRAVSLDNGDDENVVSEGLAWYLHRLASGPEGYGYDAGLASWVRLVINGVDTGLYLSAEQRDKRFLENRGLWTNGATWLYEVEDLSGLEMDEGGPDDSPLVQSLCYAPFASPSSCATPGPAILAAALPPVIHMRGLLTLGAVDTFCANPDGIFSHGKNFYFADYLSGQRLHFPWDLDSALPGGGLNHDVYAPQSAYSQVLLSVPEFRAEYSSILNDLVCGPFREAELHAFLDVLEPVLAAALAADPNNQLGAKSVAEFFAARKMWFSQRLQAVRAQIEGFVPCAQAQVTAYGTGCGGLGLAADALPLQDTTINLVTSNIPASAVLSFNLLSLVQHDPGIDLAVLGAPGCFLYVNLDVTFLLAGSGTQSRPLSIPNDPSWLGLLIYSQSASFVPGVNAFGAISSNGLALEVGVL